MRLTSTLRAVAIAGLALCSSLTSLAGSGIFLMGNLNGWQALADYEFAETSVENQYTLKLGSLEGDFKIATSDWSTIDLGAPLTGSSTVATGEYDCVRRGGNFKAVAMTNVTITLDYAEEGSSKMTISADNNPVIPTNGISGTLPVLYIITDPIMLSKDLDDKDYRDGTYWLDANGFDNFESIGSAEEMLPLEIKARGNWTRKGFAKKPFKLKLGSKQNMLGLSKSKHFALLAHADDYNAYLRNFVGFNLGKRIGLPWTPAQQPVEVVMNGDYRGLYFLTESIRVEKDRINIAELNDEETDPSLCSGGYLVELDNYEEGDQIISPEEGGNDVMRVTFDTPEVYSPLQRRFVEDQFLTMNRMVSEHNPDLWKYMDLDMAARYYIVEEIIDHRESYHGSTYLFRDRGEGQKWTFSPLWDCGAAFGRENVEGYFSDEYLFGNLWIANMRQVPGFMEKVKETWSWFWGTRVGNNGAELFADIDKYIESLRSAAVADHKRWAGAPRPNYEGSTDVVNNSDLNPGTRFVKQCLNRKTAWLAKEWGTPSATATEPVRDITEAQALPEYLTAGIDAVMSENPDISGFYNLQGLPISRAEKGQIVIKIEKGKATKVLVR